METQKLKNSTLILIFGIASILTCCCYGVIGLILGITALILSKKATETYHENPGIYTGFQNVKTGRILAIVGIVLSVVYIIFMIVAIYYFGWENMQDQDLMEEKLKEMMGQ